MATTATRRPQVALADSPGTAAMTAEDQIAVSGIVRGGAVLSAHLRGGTRSGFSLTIDGTEGTLEATAEAIRTSARHRARARLRS